MEFVLIGLAVWIAPAALLGLYLLFSVLGRSPVMEHPRLEQPSHDNDDHAPEDAANRDKREVAFPLVGSEANGGSKLHLRPVA